MPLHRWSALTAPRLAALSGSAVAVLPLGALEQHGPHLPLGTDHIIATALAERAATEATGRPTQRDTPVPIVLLPTEVVGHSPEHASFHGTVSAAAEALLARWTGIGAAVAAAGIRRLLMVNAHGGQPQIMELAARALRRDAGLLVATVSWPDLGVPDSLFPAEELRYGLHGGRIETALMRALAPDLVEMERADDFPNAERDRPPGLIGSLGPGALAWMAEDLNPSGVTGNAAAATAEEGTALLAHLVERLADIIAELADHPLPPSPQA